ncbi:MAG TPA: hypothetical protein VLC55_06215 [Burkholderiales bacterium]|nr:hypothetical protein [Burkholderiales bacterium]
MRITLPPWPESAPGAAGRESPEFFWRSLSLFNFYRVALAVVFIATSALFGSELVFGSHHLTIFRYGAAAYLLFGLACFAPIRARAPSFERQLGLQVGGDIVFMTVLTHASGGIQSGIGLLLLASIAAAGLISRGRLTLFFAALASIAALLEQTYAILAGDAALSQFFQAGMLSMGYFAVAWVAHTLAR